MRLAIGKFMNSTALTKPPSLPDFVSQLLTDYIEPNLSDVAKLDANIFRRNRLYCKVSMFIYHFITSCLFEIASAKSITFHTWGIQHL